MNHEKRNRQDKVRRADLAPKKKPGAGSDWIKMKSKYPNTCLICKQNVKEYSNILWSKSTKKVVHSGCMAHMVRQGRSLV